MFWCFGCEACGILAPQPGMEHTPPALEGEVLTTGLPEKSWGADFYRSCTRILAVCTRKSQGLWESIAPPLSRGRRSHQHLLFTIFLKNKL